MSTAKWALLGILVLPIAEIALFIVVASWIGLLATLALAIATSLAGVAVIRAAGRVHLERVRVAVASGVVDTADGRGGGLLTMLAGILLVLPGFLTDMLGGLLLIPAARRELGAAFGRAANRRDRRDGPRRVVDLDPEEWRRVPDERIEHERESRGG